jgi:hypothetical protein
VSSRNKTPKILIFVVIVVCLLKCHITFLGLAKVAILPLNLIRSTHFKFTKNFHTKHCTSTFAKPLLCAALLSVNVQLSEVSTILVRWLGGSFDFFSAESRSGKKSKCANKCLVIRGTKLSSIVWRLIVVVSQLLLSQ